jgi:hypothetical protein
LEEELETLREELEEVKEQRDEALANDDDVGAIRAERDAMTGKRSHVLQLDIKNGETRSKTSLLPSKIPNQMERTNKTVRR